MRYPPHLRRRGLGLAWMGVLLLLPLPAFADTAEQLLMRVRVAWAARDVEAYMREWSFRTLEEREAEEQFVKNRFASEVSELQFQAPELVSVWSRRLVAAAQLALVQEPWGEVEQLRFGLAPVGDRWAMVERVRDGGIEGLAHLSLDAGGYKADGLRIRLEDFELEMVRGTLFTSPASLGPTAVVFSGEGRVRIRPRLASEREQLRQFCGSEELNDRVRSMFVRISPGDFDAVVTPAASLVPDPAAAERWPAAERFYARHATSAFLLDAALPRSPWWVIPPSGDALVVFETRKHGTLTFGVNQSKAEGISLFDRDSDRQICLYPREGGTFDYSEDEGRTADILHHDLRVRLDPETETLEGVDTLRIQMLADAPTVQLHLSRDLEVESITSRGGRRHLFFRVRDRDAVMVALGAARGVGEVSLRIAYSGRLPPPPFQGEVPEAGSDEPLPGVEPVRVYTHRLRWYPQGESDDYATHSLVVDLPADRVAVASGTRHDGGEAVDGRRITRFKSELPAKSFALAVGELWEVAAEDGIRVWAVRSRRHEARSTLDTARDIRRFYTAAFGPPPYPALEVLLIRAGKPGGHAPPGVVMVAKPPVDQDRLYREDPAGFDDIPGFFLAHEIAHQWWGHGVTGQNYRERWISEGLAQYAATLWAREARGEAVYRRVMGHMARWALRTNELGPIRLGERLGRVRDDSQVLRAIAYGKATWVLHMLSQVVGPEGFLRGLTRLQADKRYSKVGAVDVRAALEAETGIALETYFRTWLDDTTLPRLALSYSSARSHDRFETRVDIEASGLPGVLPVQLDMAGAGGTGSERVEVPPEGRQLVLRTDARPRKVILDPSRDLLLLRE